MDDELRAIKQKFQLMEKEQVRKEPVNFSLSSLAFLTFSPGFCFLTAFFCASGQAY